MSDCECLGACPFFHDKMENMPSMAQMLKDRYCHDAWTDCARHQVFVRLGREGVPADLFPNQDARVTEILIANS